ncbi:ATP-binding protein [Nitratidesulfovibrio sp. HK-II]|uniref:ATP-binding protein n=1 Tax=Nitratidesulfovibrio sp. HK-II TaxID=2009266 RepID=UPI000E2EE2EC|nr:ATP-binding protein [Nitratidesulfovibrio sp. HK-II]GBO97793.1 hypothetical protein RVX_2832 [Nitratidesulfovibrio sp. HK-II]
MPMPRPRLSTPLAVTLAVATAALLLLLGGWLATSEFNARTVAEQGQNLRQRLLLRVAPAITALQLTGDLLAAAAPGRPTPADARELALSSLDNNPGVDAATVCDGAGLLAMAVRANGGMLLYVRGPDGPDKDSPAAKDGGRETPWQRIHTGAAPPGPASTMFPATGELCRRMAAATDTQAARPASGRNTAAAWTDVHPLPTASAPASGAAAAPGKPTADGAALTAVVDARCRQDGGPRYMGYSFRVNDLLASLAQGLPEGARVLVTSPRGEGHPPHETASLAEDGDPVREAALAAWRAAGTPGDAAFTFNAQGGRWWAHLSPLTDSGTRTFAGVALPQGLLLHMLLRDAAIPLLLACGGLGVLLGAWWVHARRQRAVGPDASAPMSDEALRGLLAGGESDRLEFKSTLRHNLSSGKHGKEIELAALKTVAAFLNTDGGTLAVGVDDRGQVLGLAPDGFEDADHVLRHFSALLAQHIGVEHQPHVRFTVRVLDGEQLLLVECDPATEPAILHTGKEEEFYVRMGPTSRRLALSQVMRRLRGNGAPPE